MRRGRRGDRPLEGMTSQPKAPVRSAGGTLWRLTLEITLGILLLHFLGCEPSLRNLDTLPFASHADLGWHGEVVLARESGSCLNLEVLPSKTVAGLHWHGLVDFQSKRFVLGSDVREAEKYCKMANPTPLHTVERSGTLVAWVDSDEQLYIAQRHGPRQADVKHNGSLAQVRQSVSASVGLESATLRQISFTGNRVLALLFDKQNGGSTLVLWNYQSKGTDTPAYSFADSAQICAEPGNLLALRRQESSRVSVVFAGDSTLSQPEEVPFRGTFDCELSDHGSLAYWSTNGDSTVVVAKGTFPRQILVNRTNRNYSTALIQPIRALGFRTDESLLVAIDSEGKLIQLELRDNVNGEDIKTEPINGRKAPGATGLAVHGARILIWTKSSLLIGELSQSFSFWGRGGFLLTLIAALIALAEHLARRATR